MSKTIALRTELQRLLKTVTPNVYYEEAPDTLPYPFIVYELSEFSTDYGKTLMEIEVNILGYGASSSSIEILADNLQNTLDKHTFRDTEIVIIAFKGLRQRVAEEDKQINRRRLLFELQLYEMN